MGPADPPAPLLPEIPALLIFGDSLSDGGNARARLGDDAFPCPPHWADRRCDGPLWVDHLAAGLGLPLLPSLEGGGNHAFGGARSGAGTTPKGLPNLLTQVEEFLAQGPAAPSQRVADSDPHPLAPPLDPGAAGPLVVVRAGANDYLDAPPSAAVADAVNRHLLTAVNALADHGLRRFLVPSELPWGFCPIVLPGVGAPQRRALNVLIARQNTALREGLVELAARRQLRVLQPDFHGVFLDIHAQPRAWGFREIQRPVLGASALDGGDPRSADAPARFAAVPDAQGFLWWDAWGHFTSAFHRVLAQRALEELRREGWLNGGTTAAGPSCSG